MSDVFSDVILSCRGPGTVTLTDVAIEFEGEKAAKSVFELEFVTEDVVRPSTSTLELKLEVDGISDTLSFQMTSLSEVVRFRRAIADKMRQSKLKDNSSNHNESSKIEPPAVTPGAVAVRSRPSNQKEMVDSSVRSTTSRPGAVSSTTSGDADAGTMKARRNRAAISLPPAEEIARESMSSTKPSTSEPTVLVSRKSVSAHAPQQDKPPIRDVHGSDCSSDDVSEFGEDTMDQSEMEGGGMDMSASRNSVSLRRQGTTGSTNSGKDPQNSMNASSHSQTSSRRSATRRSTVRGLRASNNLIDGSTPRGLSGSTTRASPRDNTTRASSGEGAKDTPRASTKEDRRHEKEEDPAKENSDFDEAIRLKEQFALKKIQEQSGELNKSEAFSVKSEDDAGASKPYDAPYSTLVEARVVEEGESFCLRPSAVASEVDLEAEKQKRRRFLCKIGTGCCLLMIAVLVVAVLAATDVIGGGGDEPVYVPPPTLTEEERFALIQERISNVVVDESVMENLQSPQRKALHWLATVDTFYADIVTIDESLQEKLEQRYILALFYFIMNDASRWQYCNPPETGEADACIHPTLESYPKEGIYYDQKMTEPAFRWLSATDDCSWAGVRCKDHVHVSKLLLGGYNLQGTLPVELGYLGSLEVLDLQKNSLVGPLPAEWGTLERNNTGLTTIRLDGNLLTGPIPEEWCQYNSESMKDLVLSGNQLTGTIPSCLSNFAKIENINLMENSLIGTIPDLGTLLHLKAFHVGQNDLEGSMPSSLCNLMRYEMVEASTDCADELAENYVECDCCTSCWPQSEKP